MPNDIIFRCFEPIHEYEVTICNNDHNTESLKEWRDKFRDDLIKDYLLIEDSEINFNELREDIKYPTVDEIKEWIQDQRKIKRMEDSNKIPVNNIK